MKFVIDTDTKTVTLLEQVSLKQLDAIKKFIGDGWQNWVIAPASVCNIPWVNPIQPWEVTYNYDMITTLEN